MLSKTDKFLEKEKGSKLIEPFFYYRLVLPNYDVA